MSTDHVVLENDGMSLSLDERSSTFDLDFYDKESDDIFTIKARMPPEEVVAVAMKLLQPTLYNVPDPQAFMDTVIKPALAKLYF